MKKIHCQINKITPDDAYHYFFGYYDKNPWNTDETKVLAHRADFLNRFPDKEDTVDIGTIDLKTKQFTPFTTTSAWNWQQGCQLQWITWQGKECAIYNQRKGDSLTAQVYNFESNETIDLNSSIYTINKQGNKGATLNYARLFETRKDYGIAGLNDAFKNACSPKNDGVYIVDLKSGEKKLVISLAYLSSTNSSDISMYKQWVNHIMFNPSGTRICFLHRYFRSDGILQSRLFTSDLEGKDIRLLFEGFVSHYDWKDDSTILAWAGKRKLIGSTSKKRFNPITLAKRCLKPVYYALGKPRFLMQKIMGDSYFLIQDNQSIDNYSRIGMGVMYCDGHCTYSNDKRWILTDGYTDSNNNLPLFLFDTNTDQFYEVGRYQTPKELDGELRIDLHPRFNRTATRVLIDSGMNGKRGMYMIDVNQITK
jgi:hypothetical protein